MKYGLIDSLGELQIPIQYDEILPLGGNFLVQNNGCWGVINKDHQLIVPIAFEHFISCYYLKKDFYTNKNTYYQHIEEYTCFGQIGRYHAVYSVKKKKIHPFHDKEGYTNVEGDFIDLGYLLVSKDRLYGLIDLSGKEVFPVIYDGIYQKKGNTMKVEKDGEILYVEIEE